MDNANVPSSTDRILKTLAHHRRRELLEHLLECPEQACLLDDCVEALCEGECSGESSPLEADELRTRLHHIHLPKLSESGFINYDPAVGQIEYQGDRLAEAWLERARSQARY